MATYYRDSNNHIQMYMNFASSSESYPNANREFLSNSDESSIMQHGFNTWKDEGPNHAVQINSLDESFVSQQNFQGQGLSLSLMTSLNSENHNHNPNCDIINQGSNSDGNVRVNLNPKYLKVVQELLDEVVHVKTSENKQNSRKQLMRNSKESDGEAGNGISAAEKQDLQNKISKLLSLLDEVERRYRQYYNQMQIVMSSFYVIVGSGAARPYTSLPLQTISRHFRCLRDAINGEIQVAQKSLGEQDLADGKGIGLTRLRYVDQKLRQQRALQQLGMTQYGWRPQRGLPENAVSVLRAWLFEHFLHPYPRDSDKIMLAKQTGLTRSQVSNWFINARVRLWKPMVEEMYKEEIGDVEMDSNSSHDNALIAFKSYAREDELQQNATSQGTECRSPRNAHDLEIVELETNRISQSTTRVGPDSKYRDQTTSIDGHSLCQDGFIVVEDEYHLSEMERSGSGNEVSLTLGLQHFVGNSSLFMTGET